MKFRFLILITLLLVTIPAQSMETLPQNKEVRVEMDKNTPYEFLLKGEGQDLIYQYFFEVTFGIPASGNGTFFAYGIYNENLSLASNLTEFIPEKMRQLKTVAERNGENITTFHDQNLNRTGTISYSINQSETTILYLISNESAVILDFTNQSTITLPVQAFERGSTAASVKSANDTIDVARLILYSTIDLNVTISYIQLLFGENDDEPVPNGYFGLVALLVLPVVRRRRK